MKRTEAGKMCEGCESQTLQFQLSEVNEVCIRIHENKISHNFNGAGGNLAGKIL
jgi:hypothetical protein